MTIISRHLLTSMPSCFLICYSPFFTQERLTVYGRTVTISTSKQQCHQSTKHSRCFWGSLLP